MSHSKFTSFPSSSIDSAPDSVKSSGKDELVDSCRVDIRKVLDQLSDISSLKEMSVYKLPSEKATEWATPGGYDKSEFLPILAHLEYAFIGRGHPELFDQFDHDYDILDVNDADVIGQIDRDEFLVLYYCYSSRKNLSKQGGQAEIYGLSVILVLEQIVKEHFLKRVSKEDIPFHQIQLRKNGIFVHCPK